MGSGDALGAFMLQHLRASGNQPHAVRRGGVGIGHALHQRQRALGGLGCVFGELLGCGLRAVAVQRHEVGDAAQRGIGMELGKERLPGLPPTHRQRHPDQSGLERQRADAGGIAVANQHHRLVLGGQLQCQFLGGTRGVGRQDPHAGLRAHFGWSLGGDHSPIRLSGCLGRVDAQDFCFRKTSVVERLLPHIGTGQGVMRAVVVVESPPPGERPEGQVEPAQAAEGFQRHQVSRRGQQTTAMLQRLFQMPSGVQDVGRYDQVVAVVIEALLHRVDLDVEHSVFDCRLGTPEASLRLGKETGGDVRVGVVEALRGQLGEHRCGGRPRTRPHFQHPQPSALRQLGQQRGDGIPEHPVGGPGERRLHIDIGSAGLAAAEQQGQRIGIAHQHIGQGLPATPEQPDLRGSVRVVALHPVGPGREIARQCLGQGLIRPDSHGEPLAVFFQRTGFGHHLEHPAEQAPVLGDNPKLLAQGIGVYHFASRALPSQPIQGQTGIRPRQPLQVGQKLGSALGFDALRRQELGVRR